MTRSEHAVTCTCGHSAASHTLLDGRRCYQPGCACLALVTVEAAQAFAERHGRPDPAWTQPPPAQPLTRPRTQRERVLVALRRAGQHGVTAHDFYAGVVIDGGPRISRFAARVHELRQDGHRIEACGRRAGHDVFVLSAPEPMPPPATVSTGPEPAGGQDRLFTPPVHAGYRDL